MSENETNKLSTINKLTLGNKFGLTKKIAQAQQEGKINYDSFPNRIGLVMDDSGSMDGSMADVHLAIDTFIKNCNSADTAIALYPLNVEARSLTNIFASIGLYASTIQATGGTPLYGTLKKLLMNENITRAVAFSDGSPTDSNDYETGDTIEKYIEKKIAIDTIFIGSIESSGYMKMLDIAKQTGGIFLHFTDVSVLAKSLKYLTPHYRALLEDDNMKARVEKGVV